MFCSLEGNRRSGVALAICVADVSGLSTYRVAQKFSTICLYVLIYEIISLSKSEKNSNKTIPKNPTKPQVCRYTTLWNV